MGAQLGASQTKTTGFGPGSGRFEGAVPALLAAVDALLEPGVLGRGMKPPQRSSLSLPRRLLLPGHGIK